MYIQTCVTIGVKIRELFALRGPFLDAKRTLSFASSSFTTVAACLDLARGGPARWPARVRAA